MKCTRCLKERRKQFLNFNMCKNCIRKLDAKLKYQKCKRCFKSKLKTLFSLGNYICRDCIKKENCLNCKKCLKEVMSDDNLCYECHNLLCKYTEKCNICSYKDCFCYCNPFHPEEYNIYSCLKNCKFKVCIECLRKTLSKMILKDYVLYTDYKHKCIF